MKRTLRLGIAFAIAVLVCAVWAGESGLAGPAEVNFQDLWWHQSAGSESGWGINLAHQGVVLWVTARTGDPASMPSRPSAQPQKNET